MGIDLSALTLGELKKLADNVEKAIAVSEVKQRKAARAAVNRVAKEYGVSIDEILTQEQPKRSEKKSTKKTAKKKSPAVAKFRNPADASQTWTGKGRRPNWYLAAIEGGAREADLLI